MAIGDWQTATAKLIAVSIVKAKVQVSSGQFSCPSSVLTGAKAHRVWA
jgi:hypothetical protein